MCVHTSGARPRSGTRAGLLPEKFWNKINDLRFISDELVSQIEL